MSAQGGGVPRLSVAVIACNEERNLARCLGSVAFAGELVVVDSGSTDRTIEVARHYTPHVVHQPWLGYGPQKNRAIELTTGDWVLVLDADEWLTPELAAEVRRVLAGPVTAELYELRRETLFMGRVMRHCWSEDWTPRLFLRDAARYDDRPVHERLVTREGVRRARLTAPYLHDTYRDLEHHTAKMNRYSQLFAEDPRTDGKLGLSRLLLSPVWAFLKMYVLKGGFLDGPEGLVLSVSEGYYHFLKYAKKLERKLRRPRE